MGSAIGKSKLAVLTNIIAPYRVPLYSVLADHFDFLLLHGGKESNRESWNGLEKALLGLNAVRAWGWQLRYAKKLNGRIFDEKFVHITPGFLWHLVRFQPDAVISSEMGFRSLVALAYGTAFRKPVWVWWGGTLHSERNIGWLKKAVRKAFVLCTNHWITYGQAATDYLVSIGVQRERILQSQNAVDEEQFKAGGEPLWVFEPRPVLLHVGQFIERKGIGLFLDAAAELQKQGRELSVVLVGSGPDKQALELRAHTQGLKNVHFLPAQPPSKMPSVYRSADLVVFSTLEDVWGLVANEAILSGVPVLCSKYAGCSFELFEPENIFSPEDISEFSRKLDAAISRGLLKPDKSRLKPIKQIGEEMVEEVFRFLPASTKTASQASIDRRALPTE